jgi:hypothetical protein
MLKPIHSRYIYKKQIGFTLQQKRAFKTLEEYGVNVNDFIRIAVKEKIKKDWKSIKEEKEIGKVPF